MTKTFKSQIIFTCSNCGAQYPKWQGRCLECGNWGTVGEDITTEPEAVKQLISADKPIDLSSLSGQKEIRIPTQIKELDRVLGGGLVEGGFVLLGGDPGIGKSTLALQLANNIKNILYVSGEESAEQVKLRADRLKINLNYFKFLPQTNLEKIISTALEIKPEILIIDSIQTVSSVEASGSPGSVSQITACAAKLMSLAKNNRITIISIGHVTKDGLVAGPKTLEHLVDVVIYLENDNNNYYKIARSIKNRFGPVGEIGVFEMVEGGLKEISDPTSIFIDKDIDTSSPGVAMTMIMEGSRSFLIEVQALTTKTIFGYPQRRSTGFDLNRLQILLAVIGKYAKINLGSHDIYLNIVGGFKIKDTAADLAVIVAILSAFFEVPLPRQTLTLGEVGLSGEIRTVAQIEKRLKEASRLGLNNFLIPGNKKTAGLKNINEIIKTFKK